MQPPRLIIAAFRLLVKAAPTDSLARQIEITADHAGNNTYRLTDDNGDVFAAITIYTIQHT